MMLLQSSIFLLKPDTSTWKDAQGNYNLASYVSEKGIISLLNNYHSLYDGWNPVMKKELEEKLVNLKIHDWAVSKLILKTDGDGLYWRVIQHPPLIFLFYGFMYYIYPYKISLVVGQWIIGALVPIFVFIFLEKRYGTIASTKMTFLFMVIPSFLLLSREPLPDTPLLLVVLLLINFFLIAIEKDDKILLILSGILFSISYLIKFTSLPLLLMIFLLILIFSKKDKLKNLLIFSFSGSTLALILMFFNYYIFLSFLTLIKVQEQYFKERIIPDLVRVYILNPLGTFFNFGIPISILFIISILYLFSKKEKKFIDKANIVFIFSFITCYLLFINTQLGRTLLAFLPLLLFSTTSFIKEKNINNKFMYFSFAVCFIQIFFWLVVF